VKDKRKAMQKNLLSILLFLHFPIIISTPIKQAVTYFWGGGRFGDKIVSYTTAKWVSHKYNIPLFLKEFKYSEMLRLGKEEKKFSKKIVKQFKKGVIPVRSEEDIVARKKDNVMFEIRGTRFIINGVSLVEQVVEYVSKNQDFMKQLKHRLQPVVALPQIELPENIITVAVHIRTGGGFDPALFSDQYYSRKELYADKKWPLRFPPEQYYVDQIKKISSLLEDQSLYIYIFTDDRSPENLVKRINEKVNKNNITFSYRKSGNAHDAHVIEDFYNMARFDCLIRAGSHFAIASQLLGNHKIIIYPKGFKWEGKKLIIDKVAVVDNRNLDD
jgi:hypothetical protein